MRDIYEDVVKLCHETLLLREASAALNNSIIRSNPAAAEVVRQLHQKRRLPANEELVPFTYTNISSAMPETYGVIIVFGQSGAAAIISRSNGYRALTVRSATPEETVADGGSFVIKTHASPNVKTIFNNITVDIGKIQKNMLRPQNWLNVRALRVKRSEKDNTDWNATLDRTKYMHAVQVLMKKMKPIMSRYIIQAIASLQEETRTALNHHNYDGARRLLNRLEEKRRTLQQIGTWTPEKFKDLSDITQRIDPIERAAISALLSTALHYYPEYFSDDRMYNARTTLDNTEIVALRQLLQDLIEQSGSVNSKKETEDEKRARAASSGDKTQKLSMFLQYFKRGLLL